MNILDRVAGQQPLNIEELLGRNGPSAKLQTGTARLKASSTAFLSDNPLEDYEKMMLELSQGQTATLDRIKREDDLRNRDKDKTTILEILSDPSLPEDIVRSAIEAINSGVTRDTRMSLKGNALIQEDDSIDGQPDAEREEIRGGLAELLAPTFEYETLKQGILNNEKIFKNEVTRGKVAGFFAYLAPFSTSANGNRAIMSIAEAIDMEGSRFKATFLTGELKKEVVDAFNNLTPRDKTEALLKIVDVIKDEGGVFFGSDNEFNQWLLGQEVLQGNYTNLDRFLDNATALLDILGMGWIIKGAATGARATKQSERAARSVERTNVIETTPVPSAPATNVGQVNAFNGRTHFDLVVQVDNDEIAQALFGMNRTEAIASTALPDPLNAAGVIPAKIPDPMRNFRQITPDESVLRAYRDNGAIYITPAEKAAARAHIVNNFEKATGVHLYDNMTQVGVDGDTVRLSGLFGASPDRGWLSADDAIKQAKFAFRDLGVTENNLTVVKKVNGEWVDAASEASRGPSRDAFGRFTPGEYAVRVDVDRTILPRDIEQFESFDVINNLLGRVPFAFAAPTQGSLPRHIMSPDAMFRPEITQGARTAADRAVRIDKAILSLHDEFGNLAKNLPRDQQRLLWDHIKDANHRSLHLNDQELMGLGLNSDGIHALKKWRQTWDTHFYFENADLVRTLNTQGYQLFDTGDTRLLAKPTRKNYSVTQVFDPSTDSVVSISRQHLDELYEQGGTLAQTRRPFHVDDDVVEWMVVRNNPDEYLRTLKESDQVLNYRDGYFTRRYDAAKFVEQNVMDKAGNVLYTKVVGYSDSIEDANRFLQRKAAEAGVEPTAWGRVRDDIKELTPGSNVDWDIKSAGGRISQRHRGKLLEDAAGPVDVSTTPHILDPAESATRAARSLSTRMAMRDFLETSKARIIDQYSDYFPKDRYGQPQWTEAHALRATETATSKELADARSMVEYINYLETGYINAIDSTIKGVMNLMADSVGTAGFRTAEKAFRAIAGSQPAAFAKNLTATAYLFAHPLRQWIVQPSQSYRLASINPQYWLGGGLTKDMASFSAYKVLEATKGKEAARAFFKDKNILDVVDYIEESGMLAAVDRSNLVRGPLTDLADSANKTARVAASPLNVSRRVGYDAAEQANLLFHLLTVRDRYIRDGKNLADKTTRQEAYGMARVMSWDMNMAGDFPYNQNWAGAFLQFYQIPHKAIMTYFSRTIPTEYKMKLLATDLLIYGIPEANNLSRVVPEEYLPDDPLIRDAIWNGAASAMFNAMASKIAGRDVHFDFSSLRPYELDGWAGVVAAIQTGGLAGFITESPVANLTWKDGAPIREALTIAVKFFNGHFDPNEGHDTEELTASLGELAKLASGWNAYQKARLIMETGKVIDKNGRVLKEDAGKMEAIMQMFGFPISEQRLFYDVVRASSEFTKKERDEVTQFYNETVRRLYREQIYSDNPERVNRILGMAMSIYKDNPKAVEHLNTLIVRDMIDNQDSLTRQVLELSKFPKIDHELRQTIINYYNRRGEDGEKVLKLLDDIEETKRKYLETEDY